MDPKDIQWKSREYMTVLINENDEILSVKFVPMDEKEQTFYITLGINDERLSMVKNWADEQAILTLKVRMADGIE